MPQKKGQTGNPNGRPVGSKNERTKQWEALGESIMTTHLKRFNDMLSTMDDKDFRDTMLDLFEYFKPKLSRTTIVGDPTEPIQVNYAPVSGKDK